MAFNSNGIIEAGNEILDAVNNAVSSGNYSKLGEQITDSIATATMDISKQVSGGIKNAQARQNDVRNQTQTTYQTRRNEPVRTGPINKSYFLQAPVSKSTGVGQVAGGIVATTFAGFGMLIAGGTTLAASLAAGALAIPGLITTGVFAALTAGASFIIRGGKRTRDLIRRYYEYGRLVGPAEFIEIEKLAAKANRSPALVMSDLTEMKKQGLLPSARLDTQETTLMLTDRAYGQYQQAEDARIAREATEARFSGGPAPSAASSDLLERGRQYVARVRQVNDEIPDTDAMSDKLYRLEEIMNRIFDKVKKQPQSAGDLRKFMDYYLPTTDKLLTAYVELDRQPDNLDNVARTKSEISTALDQINDGFEKLLDSMFSDMAMDISSDISVMNTMMKQDGLAVSDTFANTAK